jgi:hypothetical protein
MTGKQTTQRHAARKWWGGKESGGMQRIEKHAENRGRRRLLKGLATREIAGD